jgi:hypothetical protein
MELQSLKEYKEKILKGYVRVECLSGGSKGDKELKANRLITVTHRLSLATFVDISMFCQSAMLNGIYLNSNNSDWIPPSAILRIWKE